MKTKAPQFELPGAETVFNLSMETAEDGEKIQWAREQDARMKAEAARVEAEKQKELF